MNEGMTIKTARVYDDPAGEAADGYRVFVDRLWPRGESKEKFHYDLWAKEIAPSTELREWLHADPQHRWEAFKSRYLTELRQSNVAKQLAERLRGEKTVTLLYGARDKTHNNAVVVEEFLRSVMATSAPTPQ